jgi:phage terminase large subunit-like protein
MLGIMTAGFDIDSLAGRLYDYGKRIITGEEDDSAFGMWWWEPASPDVDIYDREAWRAANPSMVEGVLLEEDMEAAARSSRESAFRRFRLNQWVPLGGDQWMPPHLWDGAASADWVEPPEDTPIVIGFDGSVSRDATAIIAIDLERMVMWPVRVWEPNLTDQDWQVPRDEVEAELHGLFARYDVRAFGGDPAWWRGEMQGWEDAYPGRVYQWPTTNSRMAAACNTLFAWITGGNVRHNGDPTLRRHMLNAIVKDLGPLGDSIKKVKRESRMWIDAAVAAVIATDMAERFGDEIDAGLYTF